MYLNRQDFVLEVKIWFCVFNMRKWCVFLDFAFIRVFQYVFYDNVTCLTII